MSPTCSDRKNLLQRIGGIRSYTALESCETSGGKREWYKGEEEEEEQVSVEGTEVCWIVDDKYINPH